MIDSMMIIDDSATMRKIIMRTVRMSGVEVGNTEEAGNGSEALKKLENNTADFILCDINMPEMNGEEFVKKARELPNCEKTKIIMVSTECSDDIINTLMENGANGYITKPFTPEKFKEKLAPFLN
jgi:two-component system chemotaxis response regulator CheY